MDISSFSIIFFIMLIVAGVMFIFVAFIIFSPRARGKWMSKQVKSMKYMMDESKEDLKSVSDDMAYATKDGVKTIAGSFASGIKKGLSEDIMYCKHCGAEIDKDSKFCKSCGKEQ